MIDCESLKAGITIACILDDFGIKYRRNRCACPVHDGDNPTAFTFNDRYFHCFTRGCKGDIIDLTQALHNTDFKDAVEILCRKAGIAAPANIPRFRPPPPPKPVKIERPKRVSKKQRLPGQLKLTRLITKLWEAKLKQLNQKRETGEIAEATYYSELHRCDHMLDSLDEDRTRLEYELKRI